MKRANGNGKSLTAELFGAPSLSGTKGVMPAEVGTKRPGATGPYGPRWASGPNRGWREWCRQCAMQPEVLELIDQEAKRNPSYALEVAAHGFGKPPQGVTVDIPYLGQQNQMIMQALAKLPTEVLIVYATTGELPADAWDAPRLVGESGTDPEKAA